MDDSSKRRIAGLYMYDMVHSRLLALIHLLQTVKLLYV